MLEILNLRKRYGAYEAVKGVTLAVEAGEFVALVGPSGCGKTTLLKQIAGFELPSEGNINIDGRDMTDIPAALRPTRMVFQKLALFPHMTVAQNIAFPLKLRKVNAAEIQSRVFEMIELMQLKPEYLGRSPGQLSGGEQQRVALARSLISSPKLLLLDEPLSALDVKLKKVLQTELKRLHRMLGMTFIHVTHDLEEAMMLADRICVMHGGQLLQQGVPKDIYYRPVDSFVASFIGVTNLFPVEMSARASGRAKLVSPELALAGTMPAGQISDAVSGGPALLMVRPELIGILAESDVAENSVAVEVTEIFDKGSAIQFRSRTKSGTVVIHEIPGCSKMPAVIGARIRIGWATRDTFVLPTKDAA